MKFTVKIYTQDKIKEVLDEAANFYDKAGYYSINLIKKSFSNSVSLAIAFNEEKEIVGLARTIGDKIRFTIIVGLYVEPKYRKNGIGTEIIQTLAKNAKTAYIDLTMDGCDRKLKKFYKDAGFTCLKDEKVFTWNK